MLPFQRIAPASVSARGLRIAVWPDLGLLPVDLEIAAALEQAVRVFQDMGAEVEKVDLPWATDVLEITLTHLRLIFGSSIAPETVQDWDELTLFALVFVLAEPEGTPKDYFTALTTSGPV